MNKCGYKEGDTWWCENINTEIPDQLWISTWGHKAKWEQQGIHDQVSSIKGHMTKWEYQNGDTWPSVDYRNAIHDQVWTST